MKRVLLDTQALLQYLDDEQALRPGARRTIADPANEVFVSAVSVWEIAIKRAQGRLQAPGILTDLVEGSGFTELVVKSSHAERAGGLPKHHRDPFDRMLVAQAQAEGLSIVTRDRLIRLYDVPTIMA